MRNTSFRRVFFSSKVATLVTAIAYFACLYSPSYAQLIPNLGGQRAGISSFSFLKNDVSPRAIGLGGAVTTLKGDEYASQWNPAALVETGNHSFAASTRLYNNGINHSFFAANFRLRETDFMALSVNNVTSGTMERRTELQPNGTGELFSVNAMAIGLTYSKALTYRFSFGSTVKYLNETYDVYTSHNVAVDVGFIYKTDFRNFRFGVFLQNFGPNASARGSYVPYTFSGKKQSNEAYSTPTVFKIAGSLDVLKIGNHAIVCLGEINHPNDNATNLRFGAEYLFQDLFYLRTGYWANLQGINVPTFGTGFRTIIKNQTIYINYAVAIPLAFGGVNHNIGISMVFNYSPVQKSVDAAN
ncbi:MAG: PorV/PorQ family protein [Cytophagales bacterium]